MTEPSAWLCENEEYPDLNHIHPHNAPGTVIGASNRWTETPLYTREAIEAEIVAWLRDCTLSSAIPDDPAQIVDDLASAIESGDYRSKSD